jgi:hypothetical protein
LPEPLVLGRYGLGGLKLSEAREHLIEAKKTVAACRSPARQKATVAARRRQENTFGEWAEEWLERHKMAQLMGGMRHSVCERDLKRPFGNLKLEEVTATNCATCVIALSIEARPPLQFKRARS